jgi:peroxiredoxin/mono/diheme cytochrome c family protein
MLSFPLAAALLLAAPPGAPAAVADFELPDLTGQNVRPSDLQANKPAVVVFLGTRCPVARLYASRLAELAAEYTPRGVDFLALDPNSGDSADDLRRFANEHHLEFPILFDENAAIADRFGATRQLEVFVLDADRRICYHGRVDDQYLPGVQRAAPTRHDLRIALDELLADGEISVTETPTLGCLIQRPREAAAESHVTYHRDIAPLLNRYCVECHRDGQIAPFSLTSYADAAAWSATIGERIADGRMPPWHADPRFGSFANERRLSDEDKRRIFDWIAAGAPEGEPAESPPPPRFSDRWNIGTPDKIVTMSEPFHLPATGIIQNVIVEIDPGFKRDVWVRGTEVRPGNRAVVHHCTVFVGPPGCKNQLEIGPSSLWYFSDFVPGLMPSLLPQGMARCLPAGWHIYLSLHYVTSGTATTDQTSLGLVLTDDVRHEVHTFNIANTAFELKPFAADQQVEQTWVVPCDMLLLSLFPHMHLRGHSFCYEATYPSGATETLLSVPRYDFLWQHRYILAQPKPLPTGTVLRCVAAFDNSPANPANPDPTATVRYGQLTTDEMFHGYFDAANMPSDPSRTPRLSLLTALVFILACWATRRRWTAAS